MASTQVTINDCCLIARERNGKCLSQTYINARSKLRWECAQGHQWDALPGQIIKGSWCPRCSGNRRGSLAEMQLFAQSRGGKCLSEQYINTTTKLRWECKRGHQWDARPSDVKKGTWCPECARGKTSNKVEGGPENVPVVKDTKSRVQIEETEIETITTDIAILRNVTQKPREKPSIITQVNEPLIIALLALLKRLNLGGPTRDRHPTSDLKNSEPVASVLHTDYTFWEIFNAKLRYVQHVEDFQKLMGTLFRYRGQVYLLGQVYAELYNRFGFAVGRRLSLCAEALVAIIRLVKEGTVFKKLGCVPPELRTVLDLGCGTGMLARQLIEKVPSLEQVVGVDLNPEMLKHARSNVRDSHFAVEEGSITALTPVKLSRFDAVICSYTLHLLNDQEVNDFLGVLHEARPPLAILAIPKSQGSKVQAIRNILARELAAFADILQYAANKFEIFFALPSLGGPRQWVEVEERGKDPAASQIAREYQGRVITINYRALDNRVKRSGWIRAVLPPVRLVRVREHPAGYPYIEVLGPDKKPITTKELPSVNMSPLSIFHLLNDTLKDFHAFPLILLNWPLIPPLVRAYADLQDVDTIEGIDPKFWASGEFARFVVVWRRRENLIWHLPEAPRVLFFRLLERMHAKWQKVA